MGDGVTARRSTGVAHSLAVVASRRRWRSSHVRFNSSKNVSLANCIDEGARSGFAGTATGGGGGATGGGGGATGGGGGAIGGGGGAIGGGGDMRSSIRRNTWRICPSSFRSSSIATSCTNDTESSGVTLSSDADATETESLFHWRVKPGIGFNWTRTGTCCFQARAELVSHLYFGGMGEIVCVTCTFFFCNHHVAYESIKKTPLLSPNGVMHTKQQTQNIFIEIAMLAPTMPRKVIAQSQPPLERSVDANLQIHIARIRAGLTVEAVAELTKTTEERVRRLEAGKEKADPVTLRVFESAMTVS
jgi:ribosome-binding protein aMBF1 (putative translation factor)